MNLEVLREYIGVNLLMFTSNKYVVYPTLYHAKDLDTLKDLIDTCKFTTVSFVLMDRFVVLKKDEIIHQADSYNKCRRFLRKNEHSSDVTYNVIDIMQFKMWFMDTPQSKITWRNIKIVPKNVLLPVDSPYLFKTGMIRNSSNGDEWMVKKTVKKNGNISKSWIHIQKPDIPASYFKNGHIHKTYGNVWRVDEQMNGCKTWVKIQQIRRKN